MQKLPFTFPFSVFLFCSCVFISSCDQNNADSSPGPAAYALNGEPLFAPEPDEKTLAQLEEKKQLYQSDRKVADHIIWYGRFLAYAGRYRDAISIYTEGIEKFPNDARFYRHRGHRYITIREFDQAISDLEKAVTLIEGKPDEIEPDGIPNVQNIPISTLHGNIWYHLGLAYYLKQDFTKALTSYINCMRSGSNDDNIVSATHWLYTIMCRINSNMDADNVLNRIQGDFKIIENVSYHRLCLLYKGVLSPEQAIEGIADGSARDAIDYGIARWYACQGHEEKSKEILYEILSRPGWASFGYIAAEADTYHK